MGRYYEGSHPTRGAWIEIFAFFSASRSSLRRTPHGVRGLKFSVGRIGGVNAAFAYDFVVSIIGTIDYKLFIVSLYLFVKYLGGIRLWKTQKRLIFQRDLSNVK